MQIYYMKKDKLPIPVTTLVLMLVTITYKAVLVVIGIGVCIFGRGFLREYMGNLMWVFYLGVGLNIFCVSFMLILVFASGLAKKLMIKGMKLLEKIHLLKHKPERLCKLEESMDLYHETAAFWAEHKGIMVNVFLITFIQRVILFTITYWVYRAMGFHTYGIFTVTLLQSVSMDLYHETAAFWAEHKGIMVNVFLITFIQRVILFTITYWVYRAMGFHTYGIFTVTLLQSVISVSVDMLPFLITFIQRVILFTITYWVYRAMGFHTYGIFTVTLLQSVISVSVDMLPLPGGMGISETLYMVMFAPVFGNAMLASMVLSRGISYYGQLFISAVMTCAAHFIIGRKTGERKKGGSPVC